jgi:integrase
MPTQELTAKFVATATSGGKLREYFWDASLAGFGLMVTEKGAKSFVVQWRGADGRTRRMSINGGRKFAPARREAKRLLGKIANGGDPLADKRAQRDAKSNTLRKIVEDQYLVHGDVKKLRSADAKKWIFETYIFPTLGMRPVAQIKRSEIVRMCDNLKESRGPGAASNAFRALRRFFTWYAPRDDDFRSPIVPGTFSYTSGDGSRTLTDDEIRLVWTVASEGRSAYDDFVRLTLLTAARRSETAEMTRGELSPDGSEWIIPAKRYKGVDGKSAHAHLVPLAPLAREVLANVPVRLIGGKPSQFVFTTTGTTPISGFTTFREAFDKRLNAALDKEGDATRDRIVADLRQRYPGKDYQPFDKGWSPHSLRKTARTLLSRIGIDKSIAEKCLGHIESGIISVYDHHEAKLEKRTAFEALAREVERIVEGRPANVVPLSSARA